MKGGNANVNTAIDQNVKEHLKKIPLAYTFIIHIRQYTRVKFGALKLPYGSGAVLSMFCFR